MNRTQKVEAVADLERKFQSAPVALLMRFHGLKVSEINRFRREVREASGEYRVVKNTLTKRVVDSTHVPIPTDDGWLEGPTAVVFGFDDPVALTKIVTRWAEAQPEKLAVKGGLFEGQQLDAPAVVRLSKIPSREVLQAQLLGVLQAPAQRLVRALSEPGSSMARLLAARKDALGPEEASSE